MVCFWTRYFKNGYIYEDSSLLGSVDWWMVTNILKVHNAPIFRVRQSNRSELLDPEDEGPLITWNGSNLLNTFPKLWKATTLLALSCLSVHLSVHPHDFHENWCLRFSQISDMKYLLLSHGNKGYIDMTHLHYSYITCPIFIHLQLYQSI